jgi:hypothetical protein
MSFESDARVLRRIAAELDAGCTLAEKEGGVVERSLREDIQALRLIADRFDRAFCVTPGISSNSISEEARP